MQKTKIVCCFLILLTVFDIAAQQPSGKPNHKIRTLLVFFDGLRPDYITKENMPNLFAFKEQGIYGAQHHSVFPTVTRVNAASYATGSYPASHGLMGNSVYFPSVNKTKALGTSDVKNLIKINAAENGHLLTRPSIGEILAQAGERMMVFSSGSTGQAFLQNHTISGGAIINTDTILPLSMQEDVWKVLGKAPADQPDNKPKHQWITDALIHFGFAKNGPLVSAIWYSDPDGAAHEHGIGSEEAIRSIKTVDEQFGRIIAYLSENDLLSFYNIIVSADHGFVTYTGKKDLTKFLIEQKLKADETSQDVIVADGAIYVKDRDEKTIAAIVKSLQQQEWIGAIFTKGKNIGDMEGSIPGTLSFESIHWNHPERAGDILVDMNWNTNKNDKGFAGISFSEGVAGHGSISPYETHIALIASGPSFKKHSVSELPTSNIDIVPTILFIHHIKGYEKMDGRVMTELLSDNKPFYLKLLTTTRSTQTTIGKVSYKLSINFTTLGKYRYVNFASTERKPFR
ncbi:MAG: alkaline phosphatase family protein [Chitinophagaceae bacterium]